MVFIEPSVADALQGPLDNFAKQLDTYLKPNRKFQEAMQHAVGMNPELGQHLADLERVAPGSLDRLGFGELGNVLSSIPESAAGQVKRENRDQLVQQGTNETAAGAAGSGVDLMRIKDTIDYLNSTEGKAVRPDIVLHKLMGKDRAQLSTEGSEATIKGAEAGTAPDYFAAKLSEAQSGATIAGAKASVAPAQAQSDLADINVHLDAMNDVMNKNPELKNQDPMRMVRDMMAGHPADNLQTYMNLPGGREAMQAAYNAVNAQANRDERTLLAATRKQGIDATERQNILQAGQALRASGRAGTLDAWRTVLEHPEDVETIRKKDPSTLDQREKDVLHASDAQDRMQDQIEFADVQKMNTGLRSAETQTRVSIGKGASDADVNIGVGAINNLLALKGEKTGQPLQAVYGRPPDVGSSEKPREHFFAPAKQLYYVDPSTGKRVPDSAPFTEPKVGVARLESDQLQAYTMIMGVPADKRQAALTKLRQQKGNAIADAISPFIK